MKRRQHSGADLWVLGIKPRDSVSQREQFRPLLHHLGDVLPKALRFTRGARGEEGFDARGHDLPR